MRITRKFLLRLGNVPHGARARVRAGKATADVSVTTAPGRPDPFVETMPNTPLRGLGDATFQRWWDSQRWTPMSTPQSKRGL